MCLTEGEALEEEIRVLGVPVEFVGAEQSRLRRLATIVTSLRRQPADIVQAAHFYTNLYAALAARATQATSIGAIRNNLLSEMRANGTLGWGHLLLPQFLVANSRVGRDRAIERGRSPSRVLLVENAVDLGRFEAPAGIDNPRETHSIRLLSMGRLVPQKRMDRFLRLVKKVRERLPDWRVEARIVGDGPLDGELEELRATLGLPPEQVTLVGRVVDPVPLYRWADLFILTSDYEGTPNVVIEAMAAGVPVIATAVGGTTELLSQGGGVLVQPRDEASLLDAVVSLILDHRARDEMGLAGRRQVAMGRSIPSLRRRLRIVHRLALEAHGRVERHP
jgi:glycosyltransferase involved in cell wall biosynthesis